MSLLTTFNGRLKRFAWVSQGMFFFGLKLFGGPLHRPFYFAELREQLYLIGVGSLWLIGLTGMFAGQGFALAFSNELADFGSKDYLGRIMSLAIVRELGPVLTALMVAARVGSGITAELGAMKTSNQLDALTAFGIDPVRKLAVPRFMALLVMVPALTVFCDAVALLGGWSVSVFLAGVSTTVYWAGVKGKLLVGNLFVGLAKPVFYAMIIATVACYKGFASEGGTKGVGRATTESVVLASIWVLVMNFFITRVTHGLIKGYL